MSVGVRLAACSKTFADGTRALEPLDLEIRAGESLVVLGPSGCGKTTTLRLIAGLERPDPGGRVFFDGRDVTEVPVERRDVGIVFQSYALFPNLDVSANVGYGLRVRRLAAREREERVREMLELTRIEALAHRHIDQLSGGQRQRVALARALCIRPRMLLLDEPLAALDAQLRARLRAEIGELLKRLAITSVYVTHDRAEAMALGDRIVVMNHGKIAQIGTPREIYERPRSRFVAEFVGTINRLPHDGRSVFVRPEHLRIVSPAEARWRGRVANVQFFGDRVRVAVDGASDEVTIVEAPASTALAAGEPVGLHAGDAALIELPE